MSIPKTACIKKRRHSSEPSPSLNQQSIKPLRKKLLYDIDLENDVSINSCTNLDSDLSINKSMSLNDQAKRSLFTDDDVTRLAQAVKSIMIDDLRKELKADILNQVNTATAPLYAEIDKLKAENISLKKSICEIPNIASKLDDLEQHSRKSCIRISGVPQSQDEDTTELVCQVAKKLNVELTPNDISVSHRLPTAKGPKQIIARFTHAKKRSELLKATQNIKAIDGLKGINISQDLTKTRAKLAYIARNAVRAKKISKTSVRDGKVFITDNAEKKHVVTNEYELQCILANSVPASASVNSFGNSMDNNEIPYTQSNPPPMMLPGFAVRSPMNNYQMQSMGNFNPQYQQIPSGSGLAMMYPMQQQTHGPRY